MLLEVIRASLDEFFPGTFVIGVGAQLRPPRGEAGLLDWRLCGAISNLVCQGFVEGIEGEKILFWSQRRRSKIYIFGTGASFRPAGNALKNYASNIMKALLDAGEKEVVFLAEHMLGTEENVERALSFLSGFLNAGKNKPEVFGQLHVLLVGDSEAKNYYESLRKAIIRKGAEADSIELTFTEGSQALQSSRFVVNQS